MRTHTVSVRIDEATEQRIAAFEKHTGVPRSQVTRHLWDVLLAQYDRIGGYQIPLRLQDCKLEED